jgi:hypothetical protein
MSFYRAGLRGPELEFAVEKYRSHRAISADRQMSGRKSGSQTVKSEFSAHLNKKK